MKRIIEEAPAAAFSRLLDWWDDIERSFLSLARDVERSSLVEDAGKAEGGRFVFKAGGRTVSVTLVAAVDSKNVGVARVVCAIEAPLFRPAPVPFLQFDLDAAGNLMDFEHGGRAVNLSVRPGQPRNSGALVAEYIIAEAIKAPLM